MWSWAVRWFAAITLIILGSMTLPPDAGIGVVTAVAQEGEQVDRARTGGAQTLEDILRRQRGEDVPLDAGTGAGPETSPTDTLGAYGTASDSEIWRRARQGDSFTVSIPDKNAAILVQDEGESWMAFRQGPLQKYSIYALGGILAFLALFMLLRGRIRIQKGVSGRTIDRFGALERFGHWLLATSFIILALTGLSLLLGREYLIPALDWAHARMSPDAIDPAYGKRVFADLSLVGKWLHNNLSWAFMIALVLIFFLWVLRNIPTWTDVKWFAQGGGLFSDKSHPHARKFNGGQKLIFWSVIIFGGSISASGLSLLFPYEFPMFSATFEKLNALGAMIGMAPGLETALTPLQEMQYAQSWHTIVSIVLIVIIIAHIYIGSIGMQGAFSAMGSGKVDLNWAREHHDLWVAEMERKGVEGLKPLSNSSRSGGGKGPGNGNGGGGASAKAPRPMVAPKKPDSRIEPKAPTIPAE